MDTPDSSGSVSVLLTLTDGDGCCVFPHPANSTATIVVISMCFISLQLSILHPACRCVLRGRSFGQLDPVEVPIELHQRLSWVDELNLFTRSLNCF